MISKTEYLSIFDQSNTEGIGLSDASGLGRSKSEPEEDAEGKELWSKKNIVYLPIGNLE
jgi:hypothetical protein